MFKNRMSKLSLVAISAIIGFTGCGGGGGSGTVSTTVVSNGAIVYDTTTDKITGTTNISFTQDPNTANLQRQVEYNSWNLEVPGCDLTSVGSSPLTVTSTGGGGTLLIESRSLRTDATTSSTSSGSIVGYTPTISTSGSAVATPVTTSGSTVGSPITTATSGSTTGNSTTSSTTSETTGTTGATTGSTTSTTSGTTGGSSVTASAGTTATATFKIDVQLLKVCPAAKNVIIKANKITKTTIASVSGTDIKSEAVSWSFPILGAPDATTLALASVVNDLGLSYSKTEYSNGYYTDTYKIMSNASGLKPTFYSVMNNFKFNGTASVQSNSLYFGNTANASSILPNIDKIAIMPTGDGGVNSTIDWMGGYQLLNSIVSGNQLQLIVDRTFPSGSNNVSFVLGNNAYFSSDYGMSPYTGITYNASAGTLEIKYEAAMIAKDAIIMLNVQDSTNPNSVKQKGITKQIKLKGLGFATPANLSCNFLPAAAATGGTGGSTTPTTVDSTCDLSNIIYNYKDKKGEITDIARTANITINCTAGGTSGCGGLYINSSLGVIPISFPATFTTDKNGKIAQYLSPVEGAISVNGIFKYSNASTTALATTFTVSN